MGPGREKACIFLLTLSLSKQKVNREVSSFLRFSARPFFHSLTCDGRLPIGQCNPPVANRRPHSHKGASHENWRTQSAGRKGAGDQARRSHVPGQGRGG